MIVTAGSVDVSVFISIEDSTDGSPELAVDASTPGLDLEYARLGAGPVNIVEIDLLSPNALHADGGLKHIGHGSYRLDLPDAAVAAGAASVRIGGTATGMKVIPVTVQLVAFDLQSIDVLGKVLGGGAGVITDVGARVHNAIGDNIPSITDLFDTVDAVPTAAEIWSYVTRTITGGAGTSQPRINRKPDPGFTFEISRRADHEFRCTRPLRIVPGTVESVHPAINMAPIFGQNNFVNTVGTPTISGGLLDVAAEGPRDSYAFIQVSGTAAPDEEQTITVPVTMDGGEVINVTLDVIVFPAD